MVLGSICFRLQDVSNIRDVPDHQLEIKMERILQRHLFGSFEELLVQDRWTFRVALYAPWLFHWWMNQKLFPSLSMMAGRMDIFSEPDLEFLKKMPPNPDGN
nr:alpha/beta hydrolases superfamily protein [Tanacetum cinerariifolium]